MTLFIKAFFNMIANFSSGRIFQTFLKAIFATLALFILMLILLHFIAKYTLIVTTSLNWTFELTLLADFGILALSIFAFPAVLIAISSLFLENVIQVVEEKNYPHLIPIQPKFKDEIFMAIKFFFIVLSVNLLALPFYLIPGVNFFLYLAINGYLLGKEYFDLLAIRYFQKKEMKAFHTKHSMIFFFAGLIFAFIAIIPFFNLFMPIAATLFMAHIFYPLMEKNKT